MKINDLSGRRFGRLLAVRIAPKIGRRIKWYCICDCGGSKNVLTENLKSGNTQSCGCIAKENPANTIHGLRKHPLYRIWKHIKGRCCNVNDKRYYDYGGVE